VSDYRGHRVEVGPAGEGTGARIVWVVFCDPSVWHTGVLMDGAVYLEPEVQALEATAEATRRAHKLVDDYLDRQIDPRRGERSRRA
jgi:hypothetical protein